MPGTDVDGLLRSAVASLCLAAGVLHLSAAADHAGMANHVAFFVLVAIVQSALAAAVLWGPQGQRWLAAAAGGNLAVALVWALSRTTGLPVDGTSGPEAIGFKDGISTVLELGAVASAGLWCLLPEAARHAVIPSRRLVSTLLGTGVWALGASGLFAGHTHSAGHTHGAAHAHGAGAGAHAHMPDEVVRPEHPHAGAGHHGDGAHAPDALAAATSRDDGHTHAGEGAHSPSDPGVDHHAAGTRRADGATHAHDHGHGLDHGEAAPVPSQAAGHRHSGAADAHPGTAAGPAPADGHGHADGHPHDHGSSAGQDRPGHDRPDDKRPPRRDPEDDEGAPSALEDVLKLIRPQ